MAAICSLMICTGIYSQDWPMANGCRERTSWAQNSAGLVLPFEKSQVINFSAEELCYFDGVIYASVASTHNEVRAIDVSSGTVIWTFEIPGSVGGVGVVPAASQDIIVCGGQQGTGIFGLNRTTGIPVWSKPIGSMYTRNPMIDGNFVYVVTDSLYCLNLYNGYTVWNQAISGQLTPAIDESKVYVMGNGYLNAFDKATGTLIWQTATIVYSFPGIAVDQDYVYAEGNTHVRAYNKTNGNVVWTFDLPAGSLSGINQGPMAVSEDVICLSIWDDSQGFGQVYAINRANGTFMWLRTQDAQGNFSPMIANGMVFVVNWQSGKLLGFDLQTGTPVFSDDTEIFSGQPIVGDQYMYVSGSGKIVKFSALGTGFSVKSPLDQDQMQIQIAPNPFSGKTGIQYSLADRSRVQLDLFRTDGKKVLTLVDGWQEKGDHHIILDGQHLAPGIYICAMRLNGRVTLQKILNVQ